MRQQGIPQYVAHFRRSDAEPQSVRAHLVETSLAASGFAGKIGLASLGAMAGLLHDMGKYSAAFQAYIRSSSSGDEEHEIAKPKKGEIDHSSAGAQILWRSDGDRRSPLANLTRQMVALCVASHHSGLIDCISPDGEDVFSKRMSKTIEPTCRDEEDQSIRNQITDLLASTRIEDELTYRLEKMRNSKQSPEVGEFMLGLLTRFLFSTLIDADRLSAADFEDETMALQRYNGGYPDWAVLIEKLETHLAGLKTRHRVDEIRCRVSSACLDFANHENGLYQLTVPTGGGKTLASLRFALHHACANDRKMDRIIYVAPYTSIIDQNAGVARAILEKDNTSGKQIVLEHHSNLTPGRDTSQNKLLSENWDAPVVFTTAVQLLETLFGSGTRGVRRMHQLANSVIIFDEIQTIPIRTIHLFNNAINFLVGQCGSTVVLCTATQPLLDKVDARKGAALLSTDSEMMPDLEALFKDLRRVEVIDSRKSDGWTEDEIARAAVKEMQGTGSVLVVVNTKAHAREVYRRCKAEHVFHLSTSMCPAHRMEHLSRIRECLDPDSLEPVICISTQLIEAGVDVDFGAVIRSLAGLDSIAQAAGRCNRNDLRPTGRVHIVNPSGEKLDRLPDIRRAQEVCERVLHEFQIDPAVFDHDLLGPKAMSRYYHYYFFERAHEMAYPVSPREIGRNDTLFSLLSTNEQAVHAYKRSRKSAPPMNLRQSFRSAAEAFEAIDSPTQGVIVPYGEADRIIGDMLSSDGLSRKAGLLKRAQRYSVNMFPHEIQRLLEAGGLHEVWEGSGVLYLDSRHYSDEFGVSAEPVGQMKDYIA